MIKNMLLVYSLCKQTDCARPARGVGAFYAQLQALSDRSFG